MTVGGCGDTAGFDLSQTRARLLPHTVFQSFLSAFFIFLLIASALLFTPPASAQDAKPGIVGLGDLVVTGFSGTLPPPAIPPLPPGVNELDETFIDPNGASLKIFDVRNPGGPPEAQLLNAPTKFQAFARDIGQVFGLALDTSTPPNIFATSTSVHGLQIVVPDADGDGRPERIKLGQPGAQWMNGQFGVAKGGGPGTVWKINGETGDISKFADILSGGQPNSGAGLGNIAYDAKSKQLFVTDLDTGHIHRLDMTGKDLGTYDHGLQGRPANGKDVVVDDTAARANISSPSFDAEDSQTWGMTAPERRTWGVAVHSGRLYYSVEDGPQIWSVGIKEDGGFGDDPRWELDVPSDPDAYPVSDIAFQSNGLMLLAQRGGIASRYDYSRYHTPRKTRVLRYRLESPDDIATPSRWVAEPEDYAIGFPGIHRNTSGGIALGYGYNKKADGSYGFGSCEGTLWTTGDALRDNPIHGARLAKGGALNVHGLQGNALSLVRPKNEPPWETYFVDYDSQFDDPQASGHVGDVEIPYSCKKPDLRVLKRAKAERCDPGTDCTFEVEIENVGEITYEGPLVITDVADGAAVLVDHSPADWNCEAAFSERPGVYECKKPDVNLAPGEKVSLELTFTIPEWWDRNVYRNCVELTTPAFAEDSRRYNNESCEYVPMIEPDHPRYGPDLQVEKFNLDWNCDWLGICRFVVRVTNVGSADYTGPLHIHDTTTTSGAVLTHWEHDPPWNCGPLGGTSFDCTHPPVTLTPGDFREVFVWVQGPPLGLGHTFVRNCASIDWRGAPRDINGGNDRDCTDTSRFPPGHPDARARLEVDKSAYLGICSDGAGPGGGWYCPFEVDIRNTGGAPYFGPFEITDDGILVTAGGAGTLVAYGAIPPWTCAPGVGGGVPQSCTRPPVPGGLQPGDRVKLWLAFEVPAAIATPDDLINSARIAHDNDGDGVAENIEDTALAQLCTPGAAPGADCQDDLSLDKWADFECWPGFPCNFSIDVFNLGANDQGAGLVITDIPNPDAGTFTKTWESQPITCVPVGPNHQCTVNNLIPAGAGLTLAFTLDVPVDYPWTTLKNCASILPSAVNTRSFNDERCVEAFIPGPDLEPWGGTECQLGVPCPLDVRIDNSGKRPFSGAAGLKGTLAPAVQITSISSQTAGLTCSVTGTGTYQCNSPSLTLAPGASANLKLTILVPKSFKGTTITHTKQMLWPDRKVKDRNPRNDTHVSTITIEQPKEPTPPPPPPAGTPDLAVNKTANQAVCQADGPLCGFTVTVANAGTVAYSGPISIQDTFTPSNARLRTNTIQPPWRCTGIKGTYTCSHPSTTLQPGELKTLTLLFDLPNNATGVANNCAGLTWAATGPRQGSIRDVQLALAARGFDPGPADGKTGRKTIQAVRAYQKQAGLPANGRIDQVLMTSLLGPTGSSDSNPANDKDCAVSTIVEPTPETRPLVCQPPFRPFQSLSQIPKGWESYRLGTDKRFLYCAKPRPVSCPSGWRQVTSYEATSLRKKGYEVQQVQNILCARPRPVSCPSGWQQISDSQAGPMSRQGYDIQKIQGIICARAKPLSCPSGYKPFTNSNQVPKGWQVVTRQSGNQVLFCAKPPVVNCPSGYKTFTNRNQVPKGWQVITRQSGNRKLYCAKQPSAPQINCISPAFRVGNNCSCPSKAYRLKQVATNTFICELPPPPQNCPSGWRKVDRNKAKALVRQGYQIKQIGNILCARPGKKPGSSSGGEIGTQPPGGQSGTITGPSPTPQTQPQLKINPNLLKQLKKFQKLQ